MTSRWIVFLVGAAAVAAATQAVVVGGCSSDSCTKDTDCELPLICVRSSCVPPGSGGDVPPFDDGGVETDAPDTDAPPTDGDDGAVETTEGGEVPDVPDAEVGDDGTVTCTPTTSTPLVVATNAADSDERPLGIAAGDGFATFTRQPATPPSVGDGLRFMRFHTDGSSATSGTSTMSGVDMSPSHPILELPDGSLVAALAEIAPSLDPGIWVKVAASTGLGPVLPTHVPGTDANSTQPALTYDGINAVAAWTHDNAGTIEIRAQRFDVVTSTGIDTAVTVVSGPPGTGEPRIVWGSTQFSLAFYNAADSRLHVLSLDGTFAEQANYDLGSSGGETFVGIPALVWNGTSFGIAWETRGVGSSTMHLATFPPGESPVDHEPLSGAVPLSASEDGQVALAWNDVDGEWGLAWRYTQAGRQSIELARIDGTTLAIKGAPVDIRPETTAGYHPSLAFHAGSFMVVWTENPGTGQYPVYEAVNRCE